MAEQKAVAHIDEVIGHMMGKASGRDKIIHESWRRCVTWHGLDPLAPHGPYILTQERC